MLLLSLVTHGKYLYACIRPACMFFSTGYTPSYGEIKRLLSRDRRYYGTLNILLHAELPVSPRRSCTNRVAASAVGLARPACKGITRTFLNGVAELFGIRYTRETSYLRNFLIRGKQALFKLVPR